MIFLSLGTHEQPFERAIDLIVPLAGRGHEIVIQHGFTAPRPIDSVRWIELTDYATMVELITAADGFLAHAGVGSIMTALLCGVTPVVIARDPERGEHLDDHQTQLTRRLGERGIVVELEADPEQSESQLAVEAAIAAAARLRGISRGPNPQMQAAVARASERRGRALPARRRLGERETVVDRGNPIGDFGQVVAGGGGIGGPNPGRPNGG